ncbi:glycoside hydrolase family 97 protein [Bacteroides sp. K03]|uniref:glycoside hydrolase family 97 protein n=1 Tax=Bacteroides TaxID=816 RepID=UPI001C8CA346|nr:glycoside hydrolase family 97 protein [Bacteroides sp. K03]MBX9189692.1 glycoside hydrolase family 97 protein [Bacteroides sp. K03]
MKVYKLFALLLTFATAWGSHLSAKVIDIKSPNGELNLSVDVKDKIYYSVSYGSDLLLKDCYLNLQLENETLGNNPKLRSTKRGVIDESIKREIPLKNAVVKNHCNTLRMNFAGNYAVEFRVFDNGVAYRFITDKKGENIVMGEDFVLNFPANYKAHLSQPNGFKTSYEYPYTHVNTEEYKATDRMSYLPILLETNKPYKILISEADLHDYPCMFLKSTGQNGMQSLFPKVPLEFGEDGDRSLKILKEADYIAKTAGKRSFPWRFMVITKEDKQLLENEMVYNLSTPCVLEDYSWIKPGQVSWEWWHDARLYGVDFRSGYNMDSYKYYIDFASKFGIPYIIMDEGWAKSTRDPYTPNPTINLAELIQYGKERNVKIVLWLTWLTVENNFDLFKTFADWGVAGVKIDFMDRSDQWMVNYYERVAKEAAKHKLFVDFHGSFKPAGLERKYPNVLSYEGVLGMEQGGNCRPANSIYLPFMRNAVGPMDFTPGSMLSAQPEDNRSTRANAMGSGTRAYQMALFVVFESGLQMLADNPVYYYRERPCTEFISSVPVTWDETKVLYAKVGEAVVVARRKGDKWFIGGITNNEGRTINLDLSFLPAGQSFTLTSFEDGINADRQAMDYKQRESKVNNATQLTIKMVRNGGWAGVIK